jgi:hypothetical protein
MFIRTFWLKKFLLYLILFNLFIYSIFYSDIHNKFASISSYSYLDSNNNLKQNELIDNLVKKLNFDDYCNQFGEWEPLTTNATNQKINIYFKRSASFYFLDGAFFRLHFITTGHIGLSLNLSINVKLNDQLIIKENKVDSMNIVSPWTVGHYSFKFLDAKFDLNKKLIQKNVSYSMNDLLINNKLDIEIKVVETYSKQTNFIYNLKVKTKLLKSDFNSKKSSMLCAKCLYLSKPTDALSTEWWIKVNKNIGYEKIAFCNQSIKYDVGFNEMFQKYADYLEISNLVCIPNLKSTQNKPNYLKYFNQIVDEKGTLEILSIEVVNQLIVNECYLNNFDKYKHIAVMDNDETVIPKMTKFIDLNQVINFLNELTTKNELDLHRINEIKCDRYQNSSKINLLLDSYLNELNTRMKYDKPKTYYFGQGFFFKNNFAIQLMKALEEFFQNTSNKNEINVIDNLPNVVNQHMAINYSFYIRDESEINYAKSLLKLNKYIIQPYYEKNEKIIKKYTHNFDRFFMISGKINDFCWGKTIHDSSINIYL